MGIVLEGNVKSTPKTTPDGSVLLCRAELPATDRIRFVGRCYAFERPGWNTTTNDESHLALQARCASAGRRYKFTWNLSFHLKFHQEELK